MPSPSTSNALAPLEIAFKRYLQETSLHPGLELVGCRLHPAGIQLVAQHPGPEILSPHSLLDNLEAAFREIMAEVSLPALLDYEDPLLVPLQLKTAENSTPYVTHTFTWKMQETASVVFDNSPDGSQATTSTPAAPKPAVNKTPSAPAQASAKPSTSRPQTGRSQTGSPQTGSPSATIVPWQPEAIPATEVSHPPRPHFLTTTGRWIARYWVYGLAGTIVVSSSLFAYAITRPCVVGACDRIEQAAEFSTTAQSQMTGSPTPDTVLEAQENLQTAVSLLDAVPFWSQHYAAASAAKQDYLNQLQAINQFVQAQQKATQAVQDSQAPPYPVSHWVDVQQRWRQAVSLLENIPPESLAYDLAQQKLSEYQANYAAIGQRIEVEESAQRHFNMAVQTGQFATQRSDTADSLAGWQLAEREWKTAVQELNLIPQGTEAYPEAQEYLYDYRNQLTRAQGRVRVEAIANREYQQAKSAAQRAQDAVDRNQWTLAVNHWQDASASAQAVPSNTSRTASAQELVPQYQAALERARAQLRTAVAVQKMRSLLLDVCGQSATPCTVQFEPSRVQLTLNAQYARSLEAAITPPGSLDGEVTPEAERLIEAIMDLGNQAQPPLEIYDASGQFVARYRSDLGGFVRDR